MTAGKLWQTRGAIEKIIKTSKRPVFGYLLLLDNPEDITNSVIKKNKFIQTRKIER